MMKMKLMTLGLSLALSLTATSAFADGDAAKGEKIFKRKCMSCHTIEEGAGAKIGPNLFGITGKKSASVEGYNYSKAMKDADLVWDKQTLDDYLKKPRDYVKGTKMGFVGLKKESERQDVITYLETFK
ncbi:cytochrome c family protein [Sneathiella sp.]|uniref:cytochrome c family protein n=1 Tax=Sneathiella sp. TaxID=1964365 RepID=UPI0025D76D35|nr:cytochrome c family protein [Sneathiella sp.]